MKQLKLLSKLIVSFIILFTSYVKGEGNVNYSPNIESSVISHLEYLSSDSLEGRKPNTNGSQLAQQYLSTEFSRIGVFPAGSSYLLPFDYQVGFSEKHGVNVAGKIVGVKYPNKFWVVTAHYDHLGKSSRGIFNGADDNASGVAAMLALAEYFSQHTPNYSILFLATDAEEDGLKGARAFFDAPPIALEKIVLNLNLDMIATRNRNKTLYIAGTKQRSAFKGIVKAVQSNLNSSIIKVRAGHDGISKAGYSQHKINWRKASDHRLFRKHGIPYLFFSVDTHKNYHQTSDTFENIDIPFYLQVNQVILNVVVKLDSLAPERF